MYVDGFLLAVPTDRREDYRAHAAIAGEVFRDHGALSFVEAWGDDVPEGKVNSMRSAVLLAEGETVVFSWITWPDRATRDAGFAKVMADPRIAGQTQDPPFDGRRMIFGGFEVIVNL